MMEATPRPWEFHDMEANTIVTVQKPGQPVALCDARNLSDDENNANAALIVRAVNNFDEMHKELRDWFYISTNPQISSETYWNSWDDRKSRISAILAKIAETET